LDALLDSIDIPKGWTGLTDPATGKPLNLSQDELEILRRIQTNEMPEDGYDPYPVSLALHTLSNCILTSNRQLLNTSRASKRSCP
jgi:ribosome biogenesis protein ERB1